MKVAIFYDVSKCNEVAIIKDIIMSNNCKVDIYNDTSIFLQKNNITNPLSIMKDITHVLFLYGGEAIKSSTFLFFAGYALGKKLPAVLISESDSLIKLSPSLLNIFTSMELSSFASYFEKERRSFIENEVKQLSKAELLKRGYSLFNSNYVQAVKNNEIEIAKLFIDAGFSPSEKDSFGTPVLSLAVRERHTNMVKMLMENGAIVDATSKDRNYTALMDAAQIGEIEIAKVLLSHGADPNTQSKNGQTALILAVGRQDISVIDILLQAGSDYTIKDCMGMSAFDYANLFKNESILSLFNNVEIKPKPDR